MPKRVDNTANVLPGFEGLVPQKGRAGELDLSDESRYTGEVLYRDHPDVFKAVAAAIFIDGLSQRMAAARFRVSVNTVRAIRDMALTCAASDAGRAALFIKQKADRLRGIVRNRALEVILDRLSDPKEAKEISVDTLLRLVDVEQEHSEKSNNPSNNPKGDSGEIIDIDEFDSVLYGLDEEKKNAREDGPGRQEDGGDKDGAEVEKNGADGGNDTSANDCSTGNNSFQQSNGNQYLQGENQTLCNSLCKTDPNPAPQDVLDESPGDGSNSNAPRGGGVPGAGAHGGVN